MLFYTQIKREFTQASWKRGQIYFRENRVSAVRLEGSQVEAKIKGSEANAYETSLTMARGTIFNSKCSCPAHRQYETHCKHVAALAIWVVERGSLLRAGVGATEQGVAASLPSPSDGAANDRVVANPQKAAADPRLRKLLQAHPLLAVSRFVIRKDLMAGLIQGKDPSGHAFSIPVTLAEANALEHFSRKEEVARPAGPEPLPGEAILHVRGIFHGSSLRAIVVESGIRYHDLRTQKTEIHTLTYLQKQREPGFWKTSDGTLLYVPPPEVLTDREISFIQRLETTRTAYQGDVALENLVGLLTHRNRSEIIFDPAVNVPVESVPLRLLKISIGEKTGKSRSLSYEFGDGDLKIDSKGLQELARQGRLSSQYAWAGDRIYRLSISLSDLQRYATRSGVVSASSHDEALEAEEKHIAGGPFGTLMDDASHPLHPLAAYRLSLELGVEALDVDDSWGEFHDWKKTFERKKLPALPKADYGFDLRGYQKNGLTWLWSLYHRGLAALLADEMGLGKTHQVLAFLSTLYQSRRARPKKPSLVIAPTSVIAAWSQKLKKYETGLRWHVFHGSGRKLPKSDTDLVLTTYGILQREADLREREWHIVILDEAQAIKNASTISSRASRTLKGQFRIAMTGTPVENHSADLWSLMEFLLPGYLGSLTRFKRLYGWGKEVPTDIQAAALRRMVSPFLLRRTKSSVLQELPEKTEEVLICEMTEEQKKAYRACLGSEDAERARNNLLSGEKIDYANILALLTRLKQICDHPKLASVTAEKGKNIAKIDPKESGKWETFEELLHEALGSNLKVVVFTQYLGMIDLISHYLTEQGIGHTELRGDTADRGGRIERFATDVNCKVFLCSLLAGGLGIDLTSASVCIHIDRWWNPAKENQATDRLHRLGQTRGVQVFKLQIESSVEDRIASIIQNKTALSGALIEESSTTLKAFSRRQLLELLAPEAGGGSGGTATSGGEDATGSDPKGKTASLGATAAIARHS